MKCLWECIWNQVNGVKCKKMKKYILLQKNNRRSIKWIWMKGFWFVLSFWFQWQWLVHFEMMMLQKWEKHFKIEMFFKLNFFLLVLFFVLFKLENFTQTLYTLESNNIIMIKVKLIIKRKENFVVSLHFISIQSIIYFI